MKTNIFRKNYSVFIIALLLMVACDDAEYEGIVLDNPVAEFTVTDTSDVGLNGQIRFLNNTDNGVSYFWDFGDGNTSEEVEPLHVYTEMGTYTVKLIATNGRKGNFLTSEYTQNFTVTDAPFAWFKVDTIAKKDVEHSFFNKSKRATSYLWDFGDETTSTEENPIHAFAAAGQYTVTLTAYNDDMTETQWTEEITVVAPSFEEYFEEGENGGIPDTWTIIDGGTTGNTWVDNEHIYFPDWGLDYYNYFYAARLTTSSFSNPNGVDDWLITPKFTLLKIGSSLFVDVQNFYYAPAGETADPVNVYISKTTAEAGEMQYFVGTIVLPAMTGEPVNFEFPLSEVAGIAEGDEIHIGFHVATSNSGTVTIDNVVVI